jgi:hypothetical protein
MRFFVTYYCWDRSQTCYQRRVCRAISRANVDCGGRDHGLAALAQNLINGRGNKSTAELSSKTAQ